MIPVGRPFYKMSGSGNDFVVFDARREPPGDLSKPEVVQRICARGTGVGADGVVFLEPSSVASVRLTYLNADGSRADLCGNATLCTTRLAAELGAGDPSGMRIETDSGVLAARIRDGLPEIDLLPVTQVEPSRPEFALEAGERRLGFALAGVPHVVIQCDDVALVDVVGRSRPLRYDPRLSQGANVNFVSRSDRSWRIRTYERGVEGETLACGSGAVATGILLTAWGEADGPVDLETRSGRVLRVSIERDGDRWLPRLSGAGAVVFEGRLSEV